MSSDVQLSCGLPNAWPGKCDAFQIQPDKTRGPKDLLIGVFQCVSGVLWWFVYFFVGSCLVQVEVLVVMVMVANLGRRAKVKGLRPSKNNPSFLGQVQKGASS